MLLAGDANPLHRSAVRVARYVAGVTPGPDAEEAVATLTRQAEQVNSPGLSAATPAGDLLFGLPASFWLDEREYDPVPAAAALSKPMLILQGGRDYQVTVKDDLARWREGLGHRADIMIRFYETDNHLFSRHRQVHPRGLCSATACRPGRGRRHRAVAGAAQGHVLPFHARPELEAVLNPPIVPRPTAGVDDLR